MPLQRCSWASAAPLRQMCTGGRGGLPLGVRLGGASGRCAGDAPLPAHHLMRSAACSPFGCPVHGRLATHPAWLPACLQLWRPARIPGHRSAQRAARPVAHATRARGVPRGECIFLPLLLVMTIAARAAVQTFGFDGQTNPPPTISTVQAVVQLIQDCTAREPGQRPTAADALRRLREAG